MSGSRDLSRRAGAPRRLDGLLRVVAAAVEAAVDDALDASARGAKQRRHRKCRGGDGQRLVGNAIAKGRLEHDHEGEVNRPSTAVSAP